MWHYVKDKGSVGPVSVEAIAELIDSGQITPQTQVWREGMEQWGPAQQTELASYFKGGSLNQPIPTGDVSGVVPGANRSLQAFRDPTFLTRAVQTLLIMGAILSVGAMGSGILEHQMLGDFQNGAYLSEELMHADADANDLRQGLIGLAQTIVAIAAFVFFMIWVHRANYNAHQLTDKQMEFTPGWSVGWFFIPIASLWKPYQVIKEVWFISSGTPQSHIIPIWWTLWLLTISLSRASFKLSMRAEEIDELIFATQITIVSDFMDIFYNLTAFILVGTIFSMQVFRAKRIQSEVNVQPVGVDALRA